MPTISMVILLVIIFPPSSLKSFISFSSETTLALALLYLIISLLIPSIFILGSGSFSSSPFPNCIISQNEVTWKFTYTFPGLSFQLSVHYIFCSYHHCAVQLPSFRQFLFSYLRIFISHSFTPSLSSISSTLSPIALQAIGISFLDAG